VALGVHPEVEARPVVAAVTVEDVVVVEALEDAAVVIAAVAVEAAVELEVE
jgi:hypothetical protein